MEWLEYQLGYDTELKEMILFEYDNNGEIQELCRFKYDLDVRNIEQITIGFLRIYENGELMNILEV